VAKSFKDYEQEGWSKKASQYERVTLPLTSRAFEPILASFGDLTGKRLLDVCTGPGHLAGEAAARGALVDAIDFSEAMVREARARFSGIGFMEGDAEALPYDDVSFDAVACCFGRRRLTSIQNGPSRLSRIKGLQWQTVVRGDIGRQRLFRPLANRHNWHSGPQFRVDRNALISARGEL
jgi:ubiquinone/menaquinone biosynthesis C-methylase UbiE